MSESTDIDSIVAGYVSVDGVDGLEEIPVTGRDIYETLKYYEDTALLGDAKEVIEITPIGGGLARIDINVDDDGEPKYEHGTAIPLPTNGTDGLNAAVPYFVLFDDSVPPTDTPIWTCTSDAIITDRDTWSLAPVTLLPNGEDVDGRPVKVIETTDDGEEIEHDLEEYGLNLETLSAIYDEDDERFITLIDVLMGVYTLRASMLLARKALAGRKGAGSLIPRQDAAAIRKQYTPITKLANKLTVPALFDIGGVSLDVASKREKRSGKRIETHVSLSHDEPENIKYSRPLTSFDYELQGALATLWANGSRAFTPADVPRAMGHEKPTPKQLAEIAEAMEVQFRVTTYIDFTDELRGRSAKVDGEEIKSAKLKGHLFEAQGTEIETVNGRVINGYTWTRAPLLYQYAAAVGQLVSYPQRLLKTIGKGSDTMPRMAMKKAVIARVYQLKNPHSTISDRLLIKELLERAGIDYEDRKARKSMCDYLMTVLDDLVTEGEIDGYEKVIRRRSLEAVDLRTKPSGRALKR